MTTAALSRIRSGRIVNGRPESLRTWLVTSDNPAVVAECARIFGGQIAGNSVLTEAASVSIVPAAVAEESWGASLSFAIVEAPWLGLFQFQTGFLPMVETLGHRLPAEAVLSLRTVDLMGDNGVPLTYSAPALGIAHCLAVAA